MKTWMPKLIVDQYAVAGLYTTGEPKASTSIVLFLDVGLPLCKPLASTGILAQSPAPSNAA